MNRPALALPLVLLLAVPAAAQDDPLFRTLHLEMGQFLGGSIAAGDLDLDGRRDVVVESFGKLRPLAGRSDGSFVFDERLDIPGLNGGAPTSDLELADVDEDGVLDVIASGGEDLDLLFGQGNLGFTALLHSIPAIGDTQQLLVTDLDGDGDPDFAAGNDEGVRVTVHLNAGGSFPEAVEYGPIPRGREVAGGDWDLDGDTDLVFGEFDVDGLDLLFNDGAGGFGGLTPVVIAAPIDGLAAGDLDEDGDADLVTDTGVLQLLAGDGQGGFTPAGALPAPIVGNGLSIADLDEDGHGDILIGSGGIALHRGHGDLTFDAPQILAVGAFTSGLVVADFDRDGEADIATADGIDVGVSVGLGRDGDALYPGFSTSGPAQAVQLADFDHDGRLDVATANNSTTSGGCRISVGRGVAEGAFEPAADLPAGTDPVQAAGLWAGPLDDDGDPDIVFAPAGFFGGKLHVRLGDGALGFSAPLVTNAGNDLRGVDAADFDLDGHTDLVTVSNGLNQDLVLFGNGDGTFDAPLVIGAWLAPNGVTTGDWNADGLPDFAVVHSVSANALQIHLKAAGPGFAPAIEVPTNQVGVGITGGDVDLDGDLDIVCGSGGILGGGVVFLNDGTGHVTAQPPLFVSHAPVDVAIGDLDNDGLPDLLLAQQYTFEEKGGVAFLAGSSGFDVIEEFVLPFNTLDVELGDLDLDGVPDVVAALGNSQSAHVLLSRRGPFDDLQHPLAGAHGFARQTAEGTMQGGEPFAFRLADAPSFSGAFHIVGLSELNAPFKGGVLVPTPNLINGPLPVTGAGTLELAGPWVPGLPSGLELYLQFWWADAGGPKGFAASRALRATMP
jgi:FG-GAP-like repeat